MEYIRAIITRTKLYIGFNKTKIIGDDVDNELKFNKHLSKIIQNISRQVFCPSFQKDKKQHKYNGKFKQQIGAQQGLGKEKVAIATPLTTTQECVLHIGAQQELGKKKVAIATPLATTQECVLHIGAQ